jgi:ParB family chromosome partitioning protein
MSTSAETANLKNIPVDLIDRNPENPRLLFRPQEMEQLLDSINRHGVQVPISVYRDGSRYVLIDGERRWRCCVKLNHKTIPALVQEKPEPLTNLLLMFNIHALREQWDLLTIALKLPRVISLLNSDLGTRPNERQIAEFTGLSRGVIRRCKLLMELPPQHQDEILLELKKPKAKQKLTEDFYIEMERSLKTVERAMPEVILDKEHVRTVLIDKYRSGTIGNMVDLRNVAKIARAQNVHADPDNARRVLVRLFSRNDYGIEEAYKDSVAEAYDERDIIARIDALIVRLEEIASGGLDDTLRARLGQLQGELQRLLRGSNVL